MLEKTTRHQEKVPEKQKTMKRYTDGVFAKPIRQKSRQPSLIRGTSDPSRLCPVSSAFRKFLVERRETLPRSSRTRTLQPGFNHSSVLDRLKRRIIMMQRMGEKNQTNKQYNKRPDAGRPKVEEMYLAEEVILKSVQSRNFEKEVASAAVSSLPFQPDKGDHYNLNWVLYPFERALFT